MLNASPNMLLLLNLRVLNFNTQMCLTNIKKLPNTSSIRLNALSARRPLATIIAILLNFVLVRVRQNLTTKSATNLAGDIQIVRVALSATQQRALLEKNLPGFHSASIAKNGIRGLGKRVRRSVGLLLQQKTH